MEAGVAAAMMAEMSALPAISPLPLQARVVLADMPGVSRSALALVIAESSSAELVGVSDGPELIGALEQLRPDVLVIDERLLRDGRRLPRVAGLRVIVVGVDDDPAFAARAADQGAVAWLPKERDDLLVEELREAADVVENYGGTPRAYADDGITGRP